MFISLLTALTFAGAREDLTRAEIDTLTALSTWCGVPQLDVSVTQVAKRAHYSEDGVKKALASLEGRGLIVRTQRSDGFKRLSSVIYVDWRSALTEDARDDYDRLANTGCGYNFPSSRENNPHLWGDATEASDSALPIEVPRRAEAPKRTVKAKRKTAFPEDWTPNEKCLAHARENYPSMPVSIEVEKFRDYHLSKGSKNADWDAAWRTWCRNGNGYVKGAWKQPVGIDTPATDSYAPVINPATGKPLTVDDFGYACLDVGIDPDLYFKFWKPHMGLPSDPTWPHWQAEIDRRCGRC